MSSSRIGVDIGGTFTDAVLIEEPGGAIQIAKVSTTPADPSVGFLEVTQRIAADAGVNLAEVRYMIHATTVVTNAILQGSGARAGLIVSEGFRDVLEIARQVRHELYNLQTDKPKPLIPRDLCREVPERLNYRGEVLLPLSEDAVAVVADDFRRLGVNSIAICFLHSYCNPQHELRAADIIRSIHPAAELSLSSIIAPEIREYWRASTTAINAYIAPIVSTYLDAVEEKLATQGIPVELHLMQSNGGIVPSSVAKLRPVFLVESGPAAGVAAAAYFAEIVGTPNALSFDMGGTTAKMGMILDGRPRVLSEFEVGARGGSGSGLVKGSGYPILGSVLDLVEVGAGGGSAAWMDSGGVLRVGPQSAGADPGPACYMRGGKQATVTDANLVLGRLNADYFLGGGIHLSIDAARSAIELNCARPLGTDLIYAANGIVDIANATMVQAMRLVSVQRGYDPRDFSLVAFGGAGPLHANALAAELEVPLVIIPPSPGVASALGMLVSDIRHDYRKTNLQRLLNADFASINAIHEGYESDALERLARENVDESKIVLDRYLDARYVGQAWTIRISSGPNDLASKDKTRIKEAFDREHSVAYGYAVPDEPLEIVNVGLAAVGMVPRPALREIGTGGVSPNAAFKDTRPVYFAEAGGFMNTPVFDRYRLVIGNRIEGPAVIEEFDSTVLVCPHFAAEVSRFGILVIRPTK